MRRIITISATFFIGFLFIFSKAVIAHQPRIIESNEIQVVDPEISKAYYGRLSGQPHIYTIDAKEPFDLYVGILTPAINNSKRDVSAEIYNEDKLLAKIGGVDTNWKSFFEPFGQSNYWDGGEYKIRAPAGVYHITVSSTKNDSKYSLAIGEKEAFDEKEGINALRLIPNLKKDFFEESPISFIKSPFGWGYIGFMYILSFLVGFLYRFFYTKFVKAKARGISKNIGIKDRVIRLALAFGLLLWAITTSWNPILLFVSGFAFFEAIISWCAIYAAIGKNTCPV